MEKLLTVISLGQRAYGRWLFQRLLAGIIVIAGLAIVISIMMSALLIGGLYAAYISFLPYVTQPMAMLGVAVLAVLVIALLVFLAWVCLRHLRHMPLRLLTQLPLTSRAMAVLDAFADGLMAE